MTLPIQVDGLIDDQNRLSAEVPGGVPPGPVTVWISPKASEEDSPEFWMAGIAHEWADDLSDVRQDIHTLDDGEPAERCSALGTIAFNDCVTSGRHSARLAWSMSD